jgi:hypothetical protein
MLLNAIEGLPLLGARLSFPIFTSRTWIAPADGIAVIRVMGAGGSGAKGPSATGGYSAAWGCIIQRVRRGDVVSVSIGAGGAAVTVNGNGIAGGNSSVTFNGVTYTAPGGPGGIYAASGVPVVPAGPALPAGWDFGANSVRPGACAGLTGGAGVDIFMQGNDATMSASTNMSGGGGTGGPSVTNRGGGYMPDGRDAMGNQATTTGLFYDASHREWGISFYGGSGAVGANSGTNGYAGGNGGSGRGGRG